jgi:PncC family amidohydrolase
MYKLNSKITELISLCKKNKIKLATAESCTGGLISSLITSISGSSQIFELSFVTYSNQSKIDLLKVDPIRIREFGAVSNEVCSDMSKNLIKLHPKIDISISVSGIAGPNSDDTQKEVGLVYISISNKTITVCNEFRFGNIGRENVRNQTVFEAISMCINIINQLYK